MTPTSALSTPVPPSGDIQGDPSDAPRPDTRVVHSARRRDVSSRSGHLAGVAGRLGRGRRRALRRLALRRLALCRLALCRLAFARPAVRGLTRPGPVPGRLSRARPAVRAVEARALEHDADRGEQLAQPAPAGGALGQRVVGELLHHLEAFSARGAGVLVGRHRLPPPRSADARLAPRLATRLAPCLALSRLTR